MSRANSKSKWGREDYKEDAQLSALYDEFTSKLQLPPEWKYMGDVNVIADAQVYKQGKQVEQQNVCFTAGKLYRDMRTSGLNLKEYRVFWNSFSGKGGIVERQRPDFGKDWKKTCLIWNKTAEQLNQYIHDHYHDLSSTDGACPVSHEDDKLNNLRALIETL